MCLFDVFTSIDYWLIIVVPINIVVKIKSIKQVTHPIKKFITVNSKI